MTPRIISFDRACSDPSPRPGADLYFSQRCSMNAIETGLRVPDGNAFAAVCVECDKPIVDGHGVNSASGPRHLGCWKMAANQEKS